MVEASHFDPNAAYASVDRHQLQDFDPYIYRTRDLGQDAGRRSRTACRPASTCTPSRKTRSGRACSFAGTERGAFLSFDDGDHWQPLQLNLPVTSVRDFEILRERPDRRDPRSGLLGDGRHLGAAAGNRRRASSRRVPVQAGGRDQRAAGRRQRHAAAEGRAAGAEPADAAYIDYYLRTAATGPVTVEVLDSAGAVVATYSSDPTRQPQPAGRSGFAGDGRAAFRTRLRYGVSRPSPCRRGGDAPRGVEPRPGRRLSAVAGRTRRRATDRRHLYRAPHGGRSDAHAADHGSSGPATLDAVRTAKPTTLGWATVSVRLPARGIATIVSRSRARSR